MVHDVVPMFGVALAALWTCNTRRQPEDLA
jgi:hypothetical protein